MLPIDTALRTAWPPFGLSLCHDDLALREATDEDILALARIVEEGVLDADQSHFMPRLLLGRAEREEDRLADFLRYHWQRRAATRPDDWVLAFAVLHQGAVVGSQAIHGTGFPVARTLSTGSYLARPAQGRGLGLRMRAMVLELAFGHLQADWAVSGYVEGNEASRRLSHRLGYTDDGIEVHAAAGRPVLEHRLRMSREAWAAHRPAWLDAMVVTGVAGTRAFLGL